MSGEEDHQFGTTSEDTEVPHIQYGRKVDFNVVENPDIVQPPPLQSLHNEVSEPVSSTRSEFIIPAARSRSSAGKGSSSSPAQRTHVMITPTWTSRSGRTMSASPKTTARELVYSEDPGSHVTAICPLSYNRVWIAYRDTLLTRTFFLKLFNAEGKVLTYVKTEGWSSGLFSVAEDMALTWCRGKTSVQLLTLDGMLTTHDLKISIKTIVPYASKDGHGLMVVDDKLRRVTCTYAENDAETEDLEEVSESDLPGTSDRESDAEPQETSDEESDPDSCRQLTNNLRYSQEEVMMDKPPSEGRLVHGSAEGCYFAFVNDDDHHSSVNVFATSDAGLPRHISSYTLGEGRVLDARFCRMDGRDVLLVVVLGDDQVHVVDPTDSCRFLHCLNTGPFQLDKPHRLATDNDQHVWIGCWGGKVVMVDV